MTKRKGLIFGALVAACGAGAAVSERENMFSMMDLSN